MPALSPRDQASGTNTTSPVVTASVRNAPALWAKELVEQFVDLSRRRLTALLADPSAAKRDAAQF